MRMKKYLHFAAALLLTFTCAAALRPASAIAEAESNVSILDRDESETRAVSNESSVVGDRISTRDSVQGSHNLKKSLSDDAEDFDDDKRQRKALKKIGKAAGTQASWRGSDAKLTRTMQRHSETAKIKRVDPEEEARLAEKRARKEAKLKKKKKDY